MSANIDFKALNVTNRDKNQSKWKAEAKVSDWTEWVCVVIASKLQALLVSCWIRVREIYCHPVDIYKGQIDMTEPCSKWTHLLQVLQPLQLQLGLQENKKAQGFNMLLFVSWTGKFLEKRRDEERSEDSLAVLFYQSHRSRLMLWRGCKERKCSVFVYTLIDNPQYSPVNVIMAYLLIIQGFLCAKWAYTVIKLDVSRALLGKYL